MHELGLCDAMLKMIRGIAEENGLDGINSVTVEIGSLSGVMPNFMTDCWEAVVDGTEYSDTELIVETVMGEAECLDCGKVFEADLESLVCPECGGRKLTPISGRDMTIKEINGY